MNRRGRSESYSEEVKEDLCMSNGRKVETGGWRDGSVERDLLAHNQTEAWRGSMEGKHGGLPYEKSDQW